MKRNNGFTLVELLVVIAVIMVLVAVIAPVLMQSKGMSRQTSCASNMHQMGTGLIMYLADYDETYPNYRFLPLGSQNAGDFEKNSWKSVLNPYIKNKEVFFCPSNPSRDNTSDDPLFKISYAANVALNPRNYPTHPPAPPISPKAKGSGVFGRELSPGVKMTDIVSPAECISVVEVSHIKQNSFCVDIADDSSVMDDNGQPIRVYSDALFTGHHKGSNYAFADGHVKWFTPLQTNQSANFWYRDGSKLSEEGKLTLANAEAAAH